MACGAKQICPPFIVGGSLFFYAFSQGLARDARCDTPGASQRSNTLVLLPAKAHINQQLQKSYRGLRHAMVSSHRAEAAAGPLLHESYQPGHPAVICVAVADDLVEAYVHPCL